MKIPVEFLSYDGRFKLRGNAYLPDNNGAAVPAIVMTHGMADAAARIEPFAEYFRAHGLGVLLYDHRTFLPSDGGPLQEVDPIAQCRDMQMAITFAEGFSGFDRDRIALWGTSFSGGHVLAVAGMDKRVKVVVSQAPWIAGYEIATHILGADGLRSFQEQFNVERRNLLQGLPAAQTYALRKPEDVAKGFALVTTEEGYDYMVNGPAGLPLGWANSFTTRSLEYAIEFDVRPYLSRIAPAPLLMILAKHDKLIPRELAISAFDSATTTKQLAEIDAEHHTLYMPDKGFELSADAATRWLKLHL